MARILLVEDDPDQLGIRKLLLECSGHQVRTATCSQEAILQASDAELILMDLVPGCDSLVASLPETTRVIVLSGRPASGIVAARSVCQLQKPCPTRTLMSVIERALG